MSDSAVGDSENLRLDHVLVGVADLEEGSERMGALTGVTPVFGGSHPKLGTHNALLGLGKDLYLELIAVRPKVDHAGQFEFLRGCSEPIPVGWVVATDDRRRTAARLVDSGFTPGEFLAGGRVRESGERLSWQMFAVEERLLGTSPFFIEWGDGTLHPSADAPQGCAVAELSLVDPRAERLERLIAALALEVEVAEGPSRIELELETPAGRVGLGTVS